MPCNHRFIDILIPNGNVLEFLFIGTFNPEWNAANGNDAEYFYGRATNLFWCICPHAFNQNCLIDKGLDSWHEFLSLNNIGLTDVISCVNNADINFHHGLLTNGFQDKNLDLKNNGEYIFDLHFNTPSIIGLINEKQHHLKGVFFTRSSYSDIPRIWQQWLLISNHCNDLNIYNAALPTPSSRGGAIRDKILTWRREVANCE